jgi:hypothetical protein
MLSLGLTRSRLTEYLHTLATGYELKVTVNVLTAEHEHVRTVSHVLMDGQIDATAPKYNGGDVEVSRTAQMSFLDPGSTLALDSGSPSEGAYYMDRMIRVIYSVRCSFGWVDVPVFTGPIVKVDRDGDMVNVECQGKEYYALKSAWTTGTVKGRKDDVMVDLLRRTGEISRYTDFPNTSQRVDKSVSLGRDSKIWAHVWRVNASMNRVLFYDGRGVAVSRKKSSKVQATIKSGLGGMVAGEPQVSYSTDGLVNAVRVVGKKGTKHKPTPSSNALPPKSHPLSPFRLGRRGKGLYLGEFIENSDLKSTAACRRVAKDTLEDGLLQHVEASVETLPMPHLEPWDLLHLSLPNLSVRIRVTAFTLPLVQRDGDGTPMTIGANTNVRRPSRRIRKA